MVAALPKAAQLKVQQALAQWQHWLCPLPLTVEPVVKRTLAGGLSNISVLVASEEREFVLRLDGQSPQRLGLSRAAEWRAHQNAAARELAPQPVYFNPELGVLISAYCPQNELLLRDGEELDALAELLRSIHSLPPVKFRLQPLARAAHYQGLLGESMLPEEFVKACARLQTSASACLCHNDLLRENRLQQNGHLMAIDWEYTAMGDPWFDLAVICEGDQLSDVECQQLSQAYLQAPPGPEQQQRLQDNRVAYRFLTQLWQRLTGL
ncbi:MAG: phosphotransferase family protein [Gammaproteobacteria bacterium]|nr:phosphotransferase family protein [Gammaproteobacteria bacterium]